MADKKVILVSCGSAAVDADGEAIKKFMKKTASVAEFNTADIAVTAKRIEGATVVDPEGLTKYFEEDGSFAIVELGDVDGGALDAALALISEAADRRTLVILASTKGLYFAGLGINKKAGKVERSAVAEDVVATLCYIADQPVPSDCTGAVLYQLLKNVDMKVKEINKLKEALARMEVALQRDNREPWDKHDCA
ncbi:hypothetical protein [Desulfovibrio sp. UCD-KL4C]|uniref:hypothetical protein n=1 Tax=Desulfovibrio sp. UCD-KL4C TaxID=2578120 RepID=UPI0025B95942|nr:hypothetical protein [Desulfovibrio sp. UCD-KL4C]